jgi:tRNA uridine 5-carbamoylmethylation protein Kti12
MTKLPIRYIIVEGPDCAGKTSFCASLNKAVGFVRNIRDRSYLSTLCYARLYSRDCVEQLRNELREELCDANNYLIVLMPPRNVILDRLRSRGDEFQDDVSIMRLYNIFSEEVEKIANLPNVLVIKSEMSSQDLASLAAKNIAVYESFTPSLVGSLMRMWADMSSNEEVQFRLRINVPIDHRDDEVMEDPHEKEYYSDILKTCSSIIDAEVAGRNPYGSPQELDSRRFYYSSNSCISSIHFLPRAGKLKVICTLRSTDAVKNGGIDLRFLAHLSAEIPRWHAWHPEEITLDVNYNSLHIRRGEV